MKATAKQETIVTFQPITLTLQIETADELKAFQELFGCDYSIPEFLYERGDITQQQRKALAEAFGIIFKTF